MSERTAYVVSASAGQYSDQTEWLIRAFSSREAAEEHKLAAVEMSAELERWHCGKCEDSWRWCECDDKPKNTIDPSAGENRIYGEPHYFVQEVPYVE